VKNEIYYGDNLEMSLIIKTTGFSKHELEQIKKEQYK